MWSSEKSRTAKKQLQFASENRENWICWKWSKLTFPINKRLILLRCTISYATLTKLDLGMIRNLCQEEATSTYHGGDLSSTERFQRVITKSWVGARSSRICAADTLRAKDTRSCWGRGSFHIQIGRTRTSSSLEWISWEFTHARRYHQ